MLRENRHLDCLTSVHVTYMRAVLNHISAHAGVQGWLLACLRSSQESGRSRNASQQRRWILSALWAGDWGLWTPWISSKRSAAFTTAPDIEGRLPQRDL